ncbi:uncharacterized protein MYCFIDRAFT_177501 [Pseudocercospora fijiensis CIRAD86]|uniref:Uncharacterized protein n=1 Tax=Pseudocercospora fijiensis (strain CIRAD86) TaxID=383855 RepID=M3A7G5_PSEFD|nr:uncharacterized protein MYCFIDRAFT_177501 [Pseudocercospora fijiensis CIRAD86]EME80561.1 hypothetical protein MYCFIDRAFT_177501 [Pseudocercospora fijiensis CIRAD86]
MIPIHLYATQFFMSTSLNGGRSSYDLHRHVYWLSNRTVTIRLICAAFKMLRPASGPDQLSTLYSRAWNQWYCISSADHLCTREKILQPSMHPEFMPMKHNRPDQRCTGPGRAETRNLSDEANDLPEPDVTSPQTPMVLTTPSQQLIRRRSRSNEIQIDVSKAIRAAPDNPLVQKSLRRARRHQIRRINSGHQIGKCAAEFSCAGISECLVSGRSWEALFHIETTSSPHRIRVEESPATSGFTFTRLHTQSEAGAGGNPLPHSSQHSATPPPLSTTTTTTTTAKMQREAYTPTTTATAANQPSSAAAAAANPFPTQATDSANQKIHYICLIPSAVWNVESAFFTPKGKGEQRYLRRVEGRRTNHVKLRTQAGARRMNIVEDSRAENFIVEKRCDSTRGEHPRLLAGFYKQKSNNAIPVLRACLVYHRTLVAGHTIDLIQVRCFIVFLLGWSLTLIRTDAELREASRAYYRQTVPRRDYVAGHMCMHDLFKSFFRTRTEEMVDCFKRVESSRLYRA